MKYVYILQSEQDAEHFYTGITNDLEARLSKHNSGEVAHTAKYRPWHFKSYVAFTDDTRAPVFEKIPEVWIGQSLRQEASLTNGEWDVLVFKFSIEATRANYTKFCHSCA